MNVFAWPPQPSTVIGIAAIVGLVASHLTGDPFWGSLAGALAAVVMPDISGHAK
jgi:hypothetical protein